MYESGSSIVCYGNHAKEISTWLCNNKSFQSFKSLPTFMYCYFLVVLLLPLQLTRNWISILLVPFPPLVLYKVKSELVTFVRLYGGGKDEGHWKHIVRLMFPYNYYANICCWLHSFHNQITYYKLIKGLLAYPYAFTAPYKSVLLQLLWTKKCVFMCAQRAKVRKVWNNFMNCQ